MEQETKLFILSNSQLIGGTEEEIRKLKEHLLEQDQISWVITFNNKTS